MTRVGHDGEVFLFDAKRRMYISSVGRIGGTKEAPIPIPHLGKGFALQEDNVTVEFNIPPAATASEFVNNIGQAVAEIRRRAAEMGLEVAIDAAAEFSEKELDSPQARLAGCTMDYNAWTMQPNPRPDLSTTFLRTAGGHVHIETTLPPYAVIRACDVFLGIPSIILDKDQRRRKIYGGAGAFRFTPWGVEYRALSNCWLKKPSYTEWVFHQVQRAIKEVSRTREITPSFFQNYQQAVHDCINGGNVDRAKDMSARLGLALPE